MRRATSLPVQGVGGCPAGATAVQQPDFVTAISTYALTGMRVLLKRGDTFTSTSQANLVNTGPGIVGAFGTGAKPKINHTREIHWCWDFQPSLCRYFSSGIYGLAGDGFVYGRRRNITKAPAWVSVSRKRWCTTTYYSSRGLGKI